VRHLIVLLVDLEDRSILNLSGSWGILQCQKSLVDEVVGGRNAGDHHGLGVLSGQLTRASPWVASSVSSLWTAHANSGAVYRTAQLSLCREWKGTCLFAESLSKWLLIIAPWALLSLTRSEPAKSTKVILPQLFKLLVLGPPSLIMYTVRIEWLRDESLFRSCDPIRRRLIPSSSTTNKSWMPSQFTQIKSSTKKRFWAHIWGVQSARESRPLFGEQIVYLLVIYF